MKTKLFTLIMIVLIFSCSKEENGISNSDIRTELGLKKQQLSIKEIDNIKKKTEPIYFNSIDHACRQHKTKRTDGPPALVTCTQRPV